jgi:3-oxoacyl-[acyl-carrier protein] reductase
VTLTGRKSALVTGARRGIGRAIAYALAESHFDVAICDLHDDMETKQTLAGINERGARAIFVQQDIADLDLHARLVDQVYGAFGTVDCLVNNAGVQVATRGDILQAKREDFDRLLDINLRGTFFLTQEVARRMVDEDPAREGRTIVTITSANAVLVSAEKSSYCISKSALSMAVRLFAVRLAPHGIASFEVRPGLVKTDMTAEVREHYGEMIQNGLAPIRRWGEPSDIAKAVASLAVGALPYSTGHAINIDGGLLLCRL